MTPLRFRRKLTSDVPGQSGSALPNARRGKSANTKPEHLQQKMRPRARNLLDDFVGAGKEGRRHSEAQRLRGFEIYHHFEFGGLLYGQFAGLRPTQKLINEVCAASEIRCDVGAVG